VNEAEEDLLDAARRGDEGAVDVVLKKTQVSA